LFAILNPQFALRNSPFAIHNPQSEIRNSTFAIARRLLFREGVGYISGPMPGTRGRRFRPAFVFVSFVSDNP